MRLIFAGTPEFAVTPLKALCESGQHEIIAVYTQPDRPAGRGLHIGMSPVKQFAIEQHLPIVQPKTLRDDNVIAELRELTPDVMVVVAYGLILPQVVLDIPTRGFINIHASLLPAWRGAAPIQRAILAGEKMTGITIMQMDAGLDTGGILSQGQCTIEATDNNATLHHKLAALGFPLLRETLSAIAQGSVEATPQDNAQASLAPKVQKSEARMDWTRTAAQLDCQVRAFNPWPVAFTQLGEQNLRVWESVPLPSTAEANQKAPGTLVQIDQAGIDVQTGNGILRLLRVQLPGGKALPVQDFVNAKRALLTQFGLLT